MSAVDAIKTSTPSQHRDEHAVLRESCGLLDRSARGKLALTGSGAAEFLNGQVTNDVENLQAGEGCYAAFLTHKGKMLGDLRVLRTEDGLLLDTERVALQSLFDMIRRFKVGYEVELHKRTLECGLLSLIGPEARAVAIGALSAPRATPPDSSLAAQASRPTSSLAAAQTSQPTSSLAAAQTSPPTPDSSPAAQMLPRAVEHSHRETTIAGCAVRLISTDRPAGMDILCATESLEAVAAALVAAGATPVSEAAAETLRVEQGIPRYGIDLDQTVIPQEAGLNERAVSFTKGCYVGQETVARLHYRGKPNRQLRGLLLDSPAAADEAVQAGDRVVGHLRSTALSPSLGPIALSLLRREVSPGDHVKVGAGSIAAKVVELPFSS